jgi:hypothetical protein
MRTPAAERRATPENCHKPILAEKMPILLKGRYANLATPMSAPRPPERRLTATNSGFFGFNSEILRMKEKRPSACLKIAKPGNS